MMVRHGSARTEQAPQYQKALSKHWGHRFNVSDSDGICKIDFGGSWAELEAGVSKLIIRISAPSEAIAELQNVVEDHINRFARHEGNLTFEWAS